jgi:hypothetical protein
MLGAMNYLEWLEQAVPGFNYLADAERQAILHFALLWSLFESKALQTKASARAIHLLVQKREAEGRLNAADFQPSLIYFQDRYFANGEFTDHFQGLLLRRNDEPELVQQVLSGQTSAPVAVVTGLFIVIYRLRNNLFHGVKWAYGIRGQQGNFEHANAALVCGITQLGEHGA